MRVVYAGDVLSRISRRREDPRGLRRGDRFVELREFSFPAISSALRPAGEDAGIVSRSRVRTEISPAIRSARIRAALRREIELSPRAPRFSFSDVHPPMLQVDVRFRERGNLMRARPLIEHQATAVGARGGPFTSFFSSVPLTRKVTPLKAERKSINCCPPICLHGRLQRSGREKCFSREGLSKCSGWLRFSLHQTTSGLDTCTKPY